ncbi:serine threonine- kinase MRCK gamma [Pelobates cultripes]|uniref:non-specific serine/threonine protein kinase n=1 Tax=Pelobates cultripes TaxID=61616 RepID=A0AAD1WVI0_PELCU|nr:serine threonine- kinase MRCK gamma [Pelobates cultripes]CAH2325277.1 serine threonine- kinase MRCK gamma [Pelobates cultripes]CAH2325278.1 serine threonine- kinase MRCK gamma [Pelobates cultripes]CAH2325282.1 serine threonine- kinase MRCK gamma [Pelobates cultripes]CAH2325283.1 serine threonine- kinase MRCK gamma [Pelobates cultripes]
MSVEKRLKDLEDMILRGPQVFNEGTLSVETLLDVLLCLCQECNTAPLRRDKNVAEFLAWAEPFASKVKQKRLKREDFEIVKVIGRGAFGEATVVKMKGSGKIFAMKILHKWEMLKRAETACFREERDVLVKGDNQWIPSLHFAFHDDNYLYLVMDYYVGGDLLTLLSKFEDRLPEDMARFYLAEMVLAIDSIHQLKYVHRDIKPDNILIDMKGHIRLADFGSCLKMKPDGMVESSVAVGTPDYISPEILQAMEDGKGRYGTECDWWSLGVSMYELLFGETPFYAESLVETYGKIMNHEEHLQFPSDITDVSDHAKDLIRRLICRQEERLGRDGVNDFKKHPFFTGVDWDNIRRAIPPYIPEVDSPSDTSNFDVDDESLKNSGTLPPNSLNGFAAHFLPFVGFTFTSDCSLSDRGSLLSFVNNGTEHKLGQAKEQLQVSLQKSLLSNSETPTKDFEIRSLKTEMEILQKKLAERETDQESASGAQIQSLEKQIGSLKQERDACTKELSDLRERLKQQSEELRLAVEKQRKAQDELHGVEEKCEGLSAQTGRLTRRLKDKEEEVEASAERVRMLRRDLHKAEASRREAESQVEDLIIELERQKKLRERSEVLASQAAEDLDILKTQQVLASPVVRGSIHTSEMNELRLGFERRIQQLEAEISQLRDDLARREAEHASETKLLRRELGEKETKLISLRHEMEGMQDSLGRTRNDSARAQEEELENMRKTSEREKYLLKEEIKKLKAVLEKMHSESDKTAMEDVQLLEEKRESLANWEAQITDILQWVNDEKQSRIYLQALSVKMTEELESLKSSGSQTPSSKSGDSQWKARRLQKLEASARLELQSALEAEIRAKQSIQEELNRLKSDSVDTERKLQDAEEDNRKVRAELEKVREEAKSKMTTEVKPQRSLIPFLSFRSEKDLFSSENSDQSLSNVIMRRADKTDSVKNKANRKSAGFIENIEEASDKPKPHTFKVKSFTSPTKCLRCKSVMIGLVRQGVCCEVCGYMCHVSCSEGATLCPSPPSQITKILGVDPVTGSGTALEGHLSIPKPTGVKKGWQRAYVILSDFRILIYDAGSQGSTTIIQAIDMRDEHFSVSSVFESDVIHASPKDIPCIFRVAYSQLWSPQTTSSQLLLADTEEDMQKWVQVLSELHTLLRDQKPQNRSVRVLKEAYDSALPLIRTALCATIIDQERIALGTEEGLFLLYVNKNEITQLGDCKRVLALRSIPEAQQLAVLCGKSHSVRLFSWDLLASPDSPGVKIPEARGCQALASDMVCQASSAILCSASKRQVICFQLTNRKGLPRRIKEFQAPGVVQCMDILGERLCVGYPSGFSIYPLLNEGAPLHLPSPDEPKLSFLTQVAPDALCAARVTLSEFLLCFSIFGVFVDAQGKKSRAQEIMWPAPPVSCVYTAPHLTVFSENAVDIFDVRKSEWIQTVPLKKVRPLNYEGSLCLFGSEKVRLVYLHNKLADHDEFDVPETSDNSRRQMLKTKSKRHFSFRISDEERQQQRRVMMKDPQLRSKLISNPKNFNHLVHVGPGDGKHQLKDLPVAQEEKRRSSGQDITASGRPLSSSSDQVKRSSCSSQSEDSPSSPHTLMSSSDMLSEISDHTSLLNLSSTSS